MSLTPWPGDPLERERIERAYGDVRAHRGRRRLPYVGDRVHTDVSLLEAYRTLIAVSLARAEFYGELLAAQVEAHTDGDGEGEHYPYDDIGTDPAVRGLIGQTVTVSVVGERADAHTEVTPTGEETRALVELEFRERKEAARLVKEAISLGVELQQTEIIVSYGRSIAAALQAVMAELGISIQDEAVLRAAKRAGLTARRMLGHDDGSADMHVGARMTAVERVRALRAALERAESDAQAAGAVSG